MRPCSCAKKAQEEVLRLWRDDYKADVRLAGCDITTRKTLPRPTGNTAEGALEYAYLDLSVRLEHIRLVRTMHVDSAVFKRVVNR